MKIIKNDARGAGLRVGIVQARFNQAITEKLLQGTVRALKEAGVADDQMILLTVAGALEIPHALQTFADVGDIDAMVALGAVVKGDTYHFEVVCNESAAGIMRINLDSGIPIGNGVLTTYTEEQALARADQKGFEAAMTAIELAGLEDLLAEALDD